MADASSPEEIDLTIISMLERGNADQDTLVDAVSDIHNCNDGVVLSRLRALMEQNEISYSLDYDLQIKESNWSYL